MLQTEEQNKMTFRFITLMCIYNHFHSIIVDIKTMRTSLCRSQELIIEMSTYNLLIKITQICLILIIKQVIFLSKNHMTKILNWHKRLVIILVKKTNMLMSQ